MPLNIRSEAINDLAEALAVRIGTNKTETIARALRNELRRLNDATPLRERLRLIQTHVMARLSTGLETDKAFYELSGGI